MQSSRIGLCFALVIACGCANARLAKPEAVDAVAVATPVEEVTSAPEIERGGDQRTLTKNLPIRIDNPYGDVRLRFGGYESQLEWRGVVQNMGAADKIAVTGVAEQVFLISARLPAGIRLVEGQRVDITAYVPAGHDVEILTEHGLIEARGVRANLKVRTVSGDIAMRGITGGVDVETGGGDIEAQLETALPGSEQRIATSTGNIMIGLADSLNASLDLATSGVFATEFSIAVERQPGQEPNKRGRVEIGNSAARIEISSKRGEIRLLRRSEFTEA